MIYKWTIMMKTYLILVGFLVSGCASQSHLAKADDYAWTEYKCSGFKVWNDCKQAARSDCPDGFYVRNQFENITIQRREFEAACKS
jgi:hypothetical protein